MKIKWFIFTDRRSDWREGRKWIGTQSVGDLPDSDAGWGSRLQAALTQAWPSPHLGNPARTHDEHARRGVHALVAQRFPL